MTFTARLKNSPETFRRMTGITPEKFDEVLRQLTPRYEAWNANRLGRPKRKREIGGGRKFALELEDRLLMLLLYYRTYVTYAFLGFLFQIDKGSPGRMFKPIEPLLADIFGIPERRIEMSEDEIIAAFFDGTEQPTNRPTRGQRKWYSGKKKRHTIKHQVVVVKKRKKNGHGKRKLRIAAVSKAFCGKTHDKRMYEKTKAHAPPGVPGNGDLGFLGTSLIVPIKKPKGEELTQRQRAFNHRHSSQRIVAEHGIGKMKIWRICRDVYRGSRKDHTLMFKNIAGFHNLMFA
jgi:hypothetical protein